MDNNATLQIVNLEDPGILKAINNSAVPDVNELDDRKAEWLVAHSALARMATIDGHAAGVIVVLSGTAALDSDYFRWFVARYENFVYIDRVIVTATARRRGVATSLYVEVDRFAQDGGFAIASEVYSQPPNFPSLNFHDKMGYQEVGQQFSHAEGKTVSKLMKFAEHARPRD